MATYEFSIVAGGVDPSAKNFEDAFFEAGCDDATMAFQRGVLILEFARDAKSIGQAIRSAIRCVRKAGATVERIEPDPVVSLAEIAKRTGMSRAAITQFALGQRGDGFPTPVMRVTTDSPLWDWVEVARWMHARRKAGIDAGTVREAEIVKQCNDAISTGRGRLPANRRKKLEAA